MGASATLTIPMNLGSTAAREIAYSFLDNTAGVSSVNLDAAAGSARVDIQMPGNVDSLMKKLRDLGLSSAQAIDVSVPVRSLGLPGSPGPEGLLKALAASPGVASPRIDGDAVHARVVATTAALRFLFEEILHAGMMPQDVPTLVTLRGL